MLQRFWLAFLLFIPLTAIAIVGGLWLMGNVNAGLGIAVMIGVILAGTFVMMRTMMGTSKADKALLESGVEADAQITSIQDTGLVLNGVNYVIRMILQVQPSGMPAFEAKLEKTVSRVAIPPIGAWLRVKYDPANPSHVVMVGNQISVGGPVGGVASAPAAPSPEQIVDYMKSHGLDQAVATGQSLVAAPGQDVEAATALLQKAEEQYKELLSNGTEAKAAVIELHPLGIFVNGNNQGARATLTVMPDVGEPFAAEATGIISEHSWAFYQPGNIILVKFDSADSKRVSFYKSSATAPEAGLAKPS